MAVLPTDAITKDLDYSVFVCVCLKWSSIIKCFALRALFSQEEVSSSPELILKEQSLIVS